MPAAMPPAAMVPMSAMFHSGELKPMMLTDAKGAKSMEMRLLANDLGGGCV